MFWVLVFLQVWSIGFLFVVVYYFRRARIAQRGFLCGLYGVSYEKSQKPPIPGLKSVWSNHSVVLFVYIIITCVIAFGIPFLFWWSPHII